MAISSGLAGAVGAVPIGSVTAFAGANAPSGWLLCGGQTVSRTQYSGLFLTIGTTYGTGDGSTTFTLPDLRGRVPAGKDDMNGSAASRLTIGGAGIDGAALGAGGGSQTHTLSTAQMPSHTHIQNSHNHAQNPHTHDQVYNSAPSGSAPNGAYFAYGTFTDLAWRGVSISSTTATNQATTAANQYTGSGQAHTNTQPTIVLNYIIKAQ